MHHCDRGCQYASEEYQKPLDMVGITCSMSRVGNGYDHAVMESYWGTLKTAHVYRREFATREEARLGFSCGSKGGPIAEGVIRRWAMKALKLSRLA